MNGNELLNNKGGLTMQTMGGFVGGFSYLSIVLSFIKAILEILLYISAIFVSFKAVQALNIYINKNF